MRRLTLLRHAQAEPAGANGEDVDRALSLHGRDQAIALGALLRAEDAVPELVLCSAANRAVQTWKLAAGALAEGAGTETAGPDTAGQGIAGQGIAGQGIAVQESVVQEIAVRSLPELYGAGPAELLDLVRQVPPATTSVLVVGHEPVISHVASVLAGPQSQEAATAQVNAGMSTAMLAFLRTESAWADLARGRATLTGLARPEAE